MCKGGDWGSERGGGGCDVRGDVGRGQSQMTRELLASSVASQGLVRLA